MLMNLFVIDPALVRMAHDDVQIPSGTNSSGLSDEQPS